MLWPTLITLWTDKVLHVLSAALRVIASLVAGLNLSNGSLLIAANALIISVYILKVYVPKIDAIYSALFLRV